MNISTNKIDRTQVKIIKKNQAQLDGIYFWLEKSPFERILTLETIVQEYNQ